VGGHAAGEVASQLTVQVVREALQRHQPEINAYRQAPSIPQRSHLLQLVEEAIQEACAQVYDMAQQDPSKQGMSTTIALLLTLGEAAVITHVGDSRVYVIRERQVHQLTEDHSLLWTYVKSGKLSRRDAAESPLANHITRSVGRERSVQVDTLFVDCMAGDRFLLCSDGFYGYLKDDQELLTLALRYAPEDLATACIKLANRRGGKDNITVIVVQMESNTPNPIEEDTTVVRKVEALRRLPLFQYCTYQELAKILAIVHIRTYTPGQIILEEGTLGEDFFILLSGKVRVLKKGQILATFVERGTHFGEMGLLDRAPRSATVRAEEVTKVMVLRRQDFFPLLKQEPHLSVKLLWCFLHVLNNRLRHSNTELLEVRGALSTLTHDLSMPLLMGQELPWVD
jgi:serine/threonine protein phosphatase PrpC/CRP-like cAMP-binding protein